MCVTVFSPRGFAGKIEKLGDSTSSELGFPKTTVVFLVQREGRWFFLTHKKMLFLRKGKVPNNQVIWRWFTITPKKKIYCEDRSSRWLLVGFFTTKTYWGLNDDPIWEAYVFRIDWNCQGFHPTFQEFGGWNMEFNWAMKRCGCLGYIGDYTAQDGREMGPLISGNLGWWNILIWADVCPSGIVWNTVTFCFWCILVPFRKLFSNDL